MLAIIKYSEKFMFTKSSLEILNIQFDLSSTSTGVGRNELDGSTGETGQWFNYFNQ
jgi:hypothetical protein